MPGILTFKPIQANLIHNTSHIMGMDPYCFITVDNNQISGEVCHKGGSRPHWQDTITVSAAQDSRCLIEIKDKGLLLHDSNIGSCEVDLKEIVSQGRVLKWYPLNFDNQPAGELLVEASYQHENPSHLLQTNIQKQAGMGIVGMVPQNLDKIDKMEQERIEDPTDLIKEVKPDQQEQPLRPGLGSMPESNLNKGEMEIEPQLSTTKPLKEYNINVMRKRSNDLVIPLDRELQTRPNYENEEWGRKDEEKQDIFVHNSTENITRSVSEQYNKGHKDKDQFHCGHKESDGLDLTSDMGPHHVGYDPNLWGFPQNLKEMNFKSEPPK